MSMNDYNNEIEDEEFEDVDDNHQMQKFREMKSKNVDNNHYDEELVVNSSDDNLAESKGNKEDFQPRGDNYKNDFLSSKPNNQPPLPKFDITEFEKLSSNSDYKGLLGFMNRFQPATIQLDTKLKPFIPPYIPSIGEVDTFLKIHKPDRSPEELGLTVLDEQTIEGVDPDTFILKLIYVVGKRGYVNNQISSIPLAEKNPKLIQNWIDKVADLPKMSGSVPYTKNMPDIESLMQVWPEKMEQALSNVKLPNENINLGTDIYAKITCNLLDIPIHNLNSNKAVIEALHVLFSLYSVVKENQAYKNIENKADNVQSIKFN